ncbi:CDP-alcohol phosphatidyltransferase family protein [Terracoccus luteus]|uniref:Phosphatidylserine synthase n=1 Tax=Terracoccus luteus TaxID=53356 RepID=A0A839Q1F0_9MICO|nr:CDP-alcohol phosphatidyltransferase family protein [Terracoccus luteus]MBB2988086.1 phosphatidylserine synthase [Terracoccus luteus]MCP2173737.1 phosphatidylserine synthase [Terracoccus luteus]
MIDARVRRWLERPLSRVATWIDVPWVSPDRVTALGLGLGLTSALASAAAWWWPALVLWVVSRACDGLDGPLARRRAARSRADDDVAPSGAGGFFDIVADFAVYGSTVVGVAFGATRSEGVPWWPFLLVLLTYYVNGTAFLAFSSIAERTGRQIDDGRSLSFLDGLAEGFETIVVHCLWLVLPASSGVIATVWAVLVGLSAARRMVVGRAMLR